MAQMHIHFNIICDSAAVTQMHIWLSKHNGRHLCRTVQLTGWEPSMGAITVQPDSGVPRGEGIQKEPEGPWKTFASAYHISYMTQPTQTVNVQCLRSCKSGLRPCTDATVSSRTASSCCSAHPCAVRRVQDQPNAMQREVLRHPAYSAALLPHYF